MREIKFRAWDIYKRKMNPVKGLSFDYCSETGIKSEEIGVLFGEPYQEEVSIENWKKEGLHVANHHPNQDTCVLMQFTGLLDKNGKEIYEGDVVKVVFDGSLNGFDDEIREVVWGAGADSYYPAFDLKDNDMEANALSVAKSNGDIEIIGNIYENPELLTDLLAQDINKKEV